MRHVYACEPMQTTLMFIIRTDILLWIFGAVSIIISAVCLFWQRRERKNLKRELKILEGMNKRNVEFEMVLKAMKLATWKVDVPNYTVSFDSDFREYDNYYAAPDTDVSDVFSHILPEDAQRAKDMLRALLEGRVDEIHIEYRMRTLYSDELYWGESYAMVGRRDSDGKPLELIGTSRRIDEQKRVQQELTDARNKAEESDRLKSAFLANMSHEIRTPLNAIVGFSDILPLVENKEEQAHLISLIQENNHKLLRMINDIVNISKMEAGAQPPHYEDFDINALIKEKVDRFRVQNKNADIQFLSNHLEGTKLLHSDRSRVSEILEQYLLNAVKFTEKGFIEVGHDDMPGNMMRLWVRDTGRGIPLDKCETIFEHFVKLDDFVPGTGLGLPICRSVARSIGAQVGVESQEGEGSNFWLEMPVGK